MEFPSSAMGRAKLSKHLELLKMKEMPVFLAIDDVNEAEDLINLFPSSLGSENVPAFSCIALRCRDLSVMNALLNICHLQVDNLSQVCHLQVDNLSQVCHFQPTLQHSYNNLSPSCKAAFLDIVSTFYGWSWETATRVVGALAMQELESHGFISQAENLKNCKQSALREGYDLDQWHYAHNPYGHKVVTMDDLTLRFGESILLADNNWHRQSIEGPLEDHAFLQQGSSLRNLVLYGDFQFELLHPFLQGAANLKVLVLCFYHGKEILLRARHGVAKTHLGHGLRYLMLVKQKTSRLITEMVSSEIRDITLDKCDDIEELPPLIPLLNLERLRIRNCRKFKSLSDSCMKEWHSLRELFVDGCHMLREIPSQLRDIETLTHIHLSSCPGLKWFPSVKNCKNLVSFVLTGCASLKDLPAMFNCPRLQLLAVEECPGLLRLPHGIETSICLKELYFSSCKSLDPDSFLGMSSLQMLVLSGCESLEELPGQM